MQMKNRIVLEFAIKMGMATGGGRKRFQEGESGERQVPP
jgi:hypothetical protein